MKMFLGLVMAIGLAPMISFAQGRVLSFETWKDPHVPHVRPYKIERLLDGRIAALGWGERSRREQFWLLKFAGPAGRTFQTVDSLSFRAGLMSHARGLTHLSGGPEAGAIYVTGLDSEFDAQGKPQYAALTRKSLDGGRTWVVADRYLMSNLPFTGTTDITSDRFGNIFYVGHGCTSIDISAFCRWFTRASFDHGKSWTNIDEVSSPDLPFWEPQRIRVDERGRIVLTGFYSFSQFSDNVGAVTRMFEPSIRKWVNVDMLPPKPIKSTNWDIMILPSGELLSTGYQEAQGALHWMVRLSDPSGRGWRTVDSHLCSTPDGASRAGPIAVVGRAIYVGGFTQCRGQDRRHLVVRESLNAGRTWRTVVNLAAPYGVTSLTDLLFTGPRRFLMTGILNGTPGGALLTVDF